MAGSRHGRASASFVALSAISILLALGEPGSAARPEPEAAANTSKPPKPKPATRPTTLDAQPGTIAKPVAGEATAKRAQPERLRTLTTARSWGYQLNGIAVETAAASPYDLLVVDATTGLASERAFRPAEVESLKRRPDGSRRTVISYLSIGEAEDYRPDYFTAEYLTEEAPDWLMHENPQWKGNRIIRFCHEGWQRTIIGDDDGRNVYNSIEPSPLYRLIELGFDGIYLDRVDVYGEVGKECPDAERKMVDFVARLAAHARKANPHFLVVLQNAEELVRHPRMMDTIDAIAKEDLFYGADHSQRANSAASVRESLGYLKSVKAAGRAVFVIDYVTGAGSKADAKRRISEQGFVPYIGPRNLGALWLPGKDF